MRLRVFSLWLWQVVIIDCDRNEDTEPSPEVARGRFLYCQENVSLQMGGLLKLAQEGVLIANDRAMIVSSWQNVGWAVIFIF